MFKRNIFNTRIFRKGKQIINIIISVLKIKNPVSEFITNQVGLDNIGTNLSILESLQKACFNSRGVTLRIFLFYVIHIHVYVYSKAQTTFINSTLLRFSLIYVQYFRKCNAAEELGAMIILHCFSWIKTCMHLYLYIKKFKQKIVEVDINNVVHTSKKT